MNLKWRQILALFIILFGILFIRTDIYINDFSAVGKILFLISNILIFSLLIIIKIRNKEYNKKSILLGLVIILASLFYGKFLISKKEDSIKTIVEIKNNQSTNKFVD